MMNSEPVTLAASESTQPAWLPQLPARLARFGDSALAVDLLLLGLAAPALYFPDRFPGWALPLSCLLLAAGWLWRRVTLGAWWQRTPADWAMLFLFGVMLPVAVWAAPPVLREQYSWPRALIMVWNYCLFYSVATHAGRSAGALRGLTWGLIGVSALIALMAPLGIQWGNKIPMLAPLLDRIPSVLRGVFSGAESGFSPNQVAGALLFVLPLLVAFGLLAPRRGRLPRPEWWLIALVGLGMSGVLVLTQSRGGLLGFGVGVAVVATLPHRWGRWGVLIGGSLAAVSAPWWFGSLLDLLGGVGAMANGAESTLASRQEIWQRAMYGIQDFFFTGMGLGTFRAILPILYPLFTVGPDVDMAHAHNFFLQTALDFGVPGLTALLVIYGLAMAQIVRLWRCTQPATDALPLQATWRTLAVGLAGCLAAQTVYSQFDAVAMGSKPNFLLWYLLALIFGAAQWALHRQETAVLEIPQEIPQRSTPMPLKQQD